MPTIKDSSTGRDGNIRIRSNKGTAIIEETYSYIVKADSKTQSRLEILGTSGLPRVNADTASSGFTVCKAVNAVRREANPLYWDVTADFSSEVEENTNTNDPTITPPTEWVPVYETKFERLQEIATKDRSGVKIANSAGVPYETGIQLSRFIPVWNFYQFDPATVTDFEVIAKNEVVNSAEFKDCAEKTLLCTIESSTIGFYYGNRVRLTYYSLKYNKNKWTHKRLDIGTSYKSGTDLLDYTNTSGTIILGALDGSGGKQAVGTPPAEREFDMFEPVAFASFLRI